ncbi:hypothetical protein H6G73_03515 [Richelia sinica FACHB-800]|nr:hypothetical protein [Richelia sinica FACHB-800]
MVEQNFAPRITNIENYLSTLTERVQNGSVIVTGAFTTEKITPLDISEPELIEVYNNVPKVLLKNSIIAELTAKSYRENNQNQPIFLEKDDNGKYWIIVSNKNKIFLVPSINIKLHIHKLKTVEKLFYFTGFTPSADTHFLMIKSAKVSILPNGKEWKLEEKGILEFSNPSLHFSSILNIDNNLLEFSEFQPNTEVARENLYLEIKKIYNHLDDLKLQLNQFQEEQKNLHSQIGKISVLRDYVYLQIDLLKIRLDSLENYKGN